MGTIVLPPQGSLLSPHNRQNHYFQSVGPKIGRRCSQALTVPLPTEQDCARHDYSCESPPGEGLLPVPQPLGQARAFSKRSPPSSTFITPPPRKVAPASPSPMIKPKLPWSVSAILPTPSVGSPRLAVGDRSHILKGRLPFKILQGNGPGNNSDFAQGSKSKKPSDIQNSIHNKATATSGHASNVKSKEYLDAHQGLRSTFKKSHDGTGLKGQPKEADLRNRRKLEKSHSGKGARDRSQQVEFPVMTILQRPKNKEAAAELFAKFFKEGADQGAVNVNEEWVEGTPDKVQKSYKMASESDTEQKSFAEGLSDFEASEASSCRTISIPYPDRTLAEVLGTVVDKDVDRSLLVDAVCLSVSSTFVDRSDVEPLSASKEPQFGCEDLLPWERWAGPSYVNSPPPSALPLPRFSRKHLKIEYLTTAELFEGIESDQTSTKPSSISPLFTSLSEQQQSVFDLDAVATATNDLKRILNLDLCRM